MTSSEKYFLVRKYVLVYFESKFNMSYKFAENTVITSAKTKLQGSGIFGAISSCNLAINAPKTFNYFIY